MPLFFVILGLILLDSGVRGNAQQLFVQFTQDAKGFIAFAAVVMILWAVGISPSARPISKGLLILVFVVFFLKNGQNVIGGIETAASASTNNQQSPQSGSATAQAVNGTPSGNDTSWDALSGLIGSLEQSANINPTAQNELASGGTDLSQGFDQGVVNAVQHAPTNNSSQQTQQDIQTGIAVAGMIAMML